MVEKVVVDVVATIGAAYRYILNHRRAVRRIGFLLFVVSALLTIAWESFIAIASAGVVERLTVLGAIVAVNISASVATATALAASILWDAKPTGWFRPRYGLVELQISLLVIALFVAGTAAYSVVAQSWTTVEAGLYAFLGIVAIAALAVAAVRLSLGVPYSAAGRRFDLARSWHITRGNFWSLLLVNLFAFLPVVLLAYFVDAVIQRLRDFYAGFIATAPLLTIVEAAANGAIQVLIVALATALASFAFLTIAPRPIHIVKS